MTLLKKWFVEDDDVLPRYRITSFFRFKDDVFITGESMFCIQDFIGIYVIKAESLTEAEVVEISIDRVTTPAADVIKRQGPWRLCTVPRKRSATNETPNCSIV